MTKVVTVLSQKGGVGKSTATMNLAAVVAERLTADLEPDAPSPVAVVSIDPQGSAKWWADRVGDALPFYLIQAHDDPLEWLRQIGNLPGISHLFVDTPGWFDPNPDAPGDGLGDSYSADVLRTVLDATDEVIVPILAEPMCFDPTARTIGKLIAPRGTQFTVVINNFDPRNGEHWLSATRKFVVDRGWPIAETVLRHYMVHTNASLERVLVTQYKELVSAAHVQRYESVNLSAIHDRDEKKRIEKTLPAALKAADDFYALAAELKLTGEK